MAKSKIIKTDRLLIEPFSLKHLTERYVSWLNDPNIVAYSRQRHKKHTLLSCRKYFNSFKKTPNYFWAISVVNNRLGHIGNINAYIDNLNKRADLGILIGEKKAWGKGYATEAWMAVCSYLFEKVNIRKITAGTLIFNKKMIKLMKRAGMVNDGWRTKHCLFKGKEVDVIYKAIFKESWMKKNEKKL